MTNDELNSKKADLLKAVTAFVTKLSVLVDMVADKIAHDAEKEKRPR